MEKKTQKNLMLCLSKNLGSLHYRVVLIVWTKSIYLCMFIVVCVYVCMYECLAVSPNLKMYICKVTVDVEDTVVKDSVYLNVSVVPLPLQFKYCRSNRMYLKPVVYCALVLDLLKTWNCKSKYIHREF